jgi:hypothetical protein
MMADTTRIHLFDGIDAADLTVDIDRLGALAQFCQDGKVRWSMSLWLDNRSVEGFILRCARTGIELLVRDVTALGAEPWLKGLLDRVCVSGELQLPSVV